jgi:putative ABC transport system substrate-binding protein
LRELGSQPERPKLAYRVRVVTTPYDESATLAALAQLREFKSDVLLVSSPILASCAMRELPDIPIVTTGEGLFAHMSFFRTIAKPAGQVTGFIRIPSSLAKRVELLQSFCPRIVRVGAPVDAELSSDPVFLENLAQENHLLEARGAIVIPLYVSAQDIISALPAEIDRQKLDALDIGYSIAVRTRFNELKSLLRRLRIPHIYNQVTAVERGGALAAQAARFNIAKTGAEYISRIAHGEPAGDIPVQVSRAYEIVLDTERIKDFRDCDPRRIAKLATGFSP